MRGRIESLVEEREVGEIVRAGTGMGWMDIWVRAKDKGKARRAVEAIMKKAAFSPLLPPQITTPYNHRITEQGTSYAMAA
jgi:hypothetical protein